MARLTKCDVCRSRKVKCDEQRPQCGNCKVKNRHCTYQQEELWISIYNRNRGNHHSRVWKSSRGSSVRGRVEVSEIHPNRAQASGKDSKYEHGRNPITTEPQALAREENIYKQHLVSIPLRTLSREEETREKESGVSITADIARCLSSQRLPLMLHTPAINQQLLVACFLGCYLPTPPHCAEYSTASSWIRSLPDNMGRYNFLDLALSALGLAYIGKIHRVDAYVKQITKYYHSVLQFMSSAILRFSNEEEILATCMVLAMYEMVHTTCEDVRGWTFHINGACELLRRRGAPSNVRHLNLGLYRRIRTSALWDSLGGGKQCFLASPEWQGTSDAPYDQLLDILLVLPCVAKELDQTEWIIISRETAMDVLEKLLGQYLATRDQLMCWYSDFQVNTPGPLFSFEPLSEDTYSDLHPDFDLEGEFSQAIIFSDPNTGEVMLLYWAGEMFLLDIVVKLLSIHQDLRKSAPLDESAVTYINDTSESETIQDVQTLGETFATKICQTVLGYCQDHLSGYRVQSTIVPLWTAQQFFQSRFISKSRLCHTVLGSMERQGFNIARPLRHLSRSYYKSILNRSVL